MEEELSSADLHVLRCLNTTAVVDPSRGGEIRSARLEGHEILSVMSWPRTAPPDASAPDEHEFTYAWGGGWQLAFPNAGNVSTYAGRRYGFHGDASLRPWQVAEASDSSVLLEWTSGDLSVRRRTTALEDGLHVATEVSALGEVPEPFIAVEHLILGGTVTDGGYRLDLPPVELVDLYDAGRRRSQWPGGIDESSGCAWDEVRVGAHVTRFGAAGPMPRGELRVIPGALDASLELTWDNKALPHVWIWEEQDGDQSPPWNGCTHALGIEPSMVPDDGGIGAAARSGNLSHVEPGAPRSWWISLRLAELGSPL